MRTGLLMAVCAVALLAGCLGGTGTPTAPSATATTPTDPGTQEPMDTVSAPCTEWDSLPTPEEPPTGFTNTSPPSFPAGTSPDGIEVLPLKQGHGAWLANTSYTRVTYWRSLDSDALSVRREWSYDPVTQRATGRERIHGQEDRDWIASFYENETVYECFEDGRRSTSDKRLSELLNKATFAEGRIDSILARFSYNYAGQRTVDGRTLLRFESTTDRRYPNSAQTNTSTLVLDERGIIRHVQLNLSTGDERYRWTTEYRNLGNTSVDRPTWVDDG